LEVVDSGEIILAFDPSRPSLRFVIKSPRILGTLRQCSSGAYCYAQKRIIYVGYITQTLLSMLVLVERAGSGHGAFLVLEFVEGGS